MRPERRLKRRNGGGGLGRPGSQNQTRRSYAYCGQKMVLTMGATFMFVHPANCLVWKFGPRLEKSRGLEGIFK